MEGGCNHIMPGRILRTVDASGDRGWLWSYLLGLSPLLNAVWLDVRNLRFLRG